MLPKYSEIVDLMKKGSNIEAQEKIMELREYALELKEENNNLKTKLSELEQLLAKKEEYELVETEMKTILYESKTEPKHYICPKCYSNNKIHILQLNGDYMVCPNCSNKYRIKKSERKTLRTKYQRI